MNTRAKELLCAYSPATAKLFEAVEFARNDRLRVSSHSDDANLFDFQPYATVGGKIVAASFTAQRTSVDRLVEVKELRDGRFLAPLTDFNVIVLDHVWGDRIVFHDEKAQAAYAEVQLRLFSQQSVVKRITHFFQTGEAIDQPEGWIDNADPDLQLSAYQKVAAWCSLESEGFGLNMDTGTGKTPVAINVLCNRAKKHFERTGKPFLCLLQCPKNVKTNWMREIAKFATVPGRACILKGSALNRVKQLIEIADPQQGMYFAVVIGSYETIVRSWDAIKLFEWHLGIIDELHNFKAPKTKRTKHMLEEVRDACQYRIGLTGTPVANGIEDLFANLEWCGRGFSGFTTHSEFRKYYNKFEDEKPKTNYQGVKVLQGYQNVPLLHERLSRHTFTISKEQAMPWLPKRSPLLLTAGMSDEQAKVYKSLADQLAAQIEDTLSGEITAITINHVLTKLLRLSQVTSGYYVVDAEYNEDGVPLLTGWDRIRFFESIPKMDELVNYIQGTPTDDKCIVWTNWLPAMWKISQRLDEVGVNNVVFCGEMSDEMRDKATAAFNLDPKYKVLIGTPKSGGPGLNLPGYDPMRADQYSTNANHTIYYSSNWSHIERYQSSDRNYGRNRCRGPVTLVDLIVPGTIDGEIYQRLQAKKEIALEAADVRAMLTSMVQYDPDEE